MTTSGQIEAGAEMTPTAGERLRLAREALKLSQQDVAERMRIDVAKVVALESDEIGRVGAPVFVAGYIRAYARIVGLPADELIPEFPGLGHADTGPASLTSDTGGASLGRLKADRTASFSMGGSRRRGQRVRKIGLGLLVLAIAAVVLWMVMGGWVQLSEPQEGNSAYKLPPQKSSSEDAGTGQQVLTIPEQDDDEPASDSVAADEALLAKPEDEELLAKPELDVQDGLPADEQANILESMTADGLDELSLYFQDDSWVEVQDARGQRLIHQLARAGQTHTLHGAAPFALVLGYVPGVTISFNGEDVDLGKYRGRRLARFSVGADRANEN